jgi:hypothetical protein
MPQKAPEEQGQITRIGIRIKHLQSHRYRNSGRFFLPFLLFCFGKDIRPDLKDDELLGKDSK